MTSKSRATKQTLAAGGVLVSACAVCCAPLIITPAVAFFAASGIGLALVGKVGLGIAALAALGGYLYLRRRAVRRNTGACGCSPDGGCSETGRTRLAP